LKDEFAAKNDKSFEDFAAKYRVKYEDYINKYQESAAKGDPVFPKPSQPTQKLEKIYVGPDGLFSLLSRRLANGLALELKKQRGLKLDDVPLGLDPIVVGDILQRHQPSKGQKWSDTAPKALVELLTESEKRSDDQSLIQNWYRKEKSTTAVFYTPEWLK